MTKQPLGFGLGRNKEVDEKESFTEKEKKRGGEIGKLEGANK